MFFYSSELNVFELRFANVTNVQICVLVKCVYSVRVCVCAWVYLFVIKYSIVILFVSVISVNIAVVVATMYDNLLQLSLQQVKCYYLLFSHFLKWRRRGKLSHNEGQHLNRKLQKKNNIMTMKTEHKMWNTLRKALCGFFTNYYLLR